MAKKNSPYKKATCFFVLVALILRFLFAEHTAFAQIIPEYTFIPSNIITAEMILTATAYVSPDEIWFSGMHGDDGIWLIKANKSGEILWSKVFSSTNNKKFRINGIQKANNSLLLGIIDSKTSLGQVALLSDGAIKQTISIGSAKVFSYRSSPLGLLAQGVVYDKTAESCAPQTTLIDMDGQIVFQYTGTPYATSIDQGALSSSICCASSEAIYIVEHRANYNQELICLDISGNEQWRIPLKSDSTIAATSISAANKNIYISGLSHSFAHDGTPINHQAQVQCYSIQGEFYWEQSFDTPQCFLFSTALEDLCSFVGVENGYWYIATINSEGEICTNTYINAIDKFINAPYLISKNELLVLGRAKESLLLCHFSF